jgi:hypothetical protein
VASAREGGLLRRHGKRGEVASMREAWPWARGATGREGGVAAAISVE